MSRQAITVWGCKKNFPPPYHLHIHLSNLATKVQKKEQLWYKHTNLMVGIVQIVPQIKEVGQLLARLKAIKVESSVRLKAIKWRG